MSAIKRAVVAVDFSDSSSEAVAVAREVVGRNGRLHLLHVVADVLRSPWVAEAGGDLDQVQHNWLADAEERLVIFAACLNLDPLKTTTRIAVGSPDAEIIRHASEQGADVIVLGSRGHGPLRRVLLGSVTERVERHAPCPVIVVLLRKHLRTAAGLKPWATSASRRRGGGRSAATI
jgi:nucleotide-binding universal stress UspA family protein